MLKSKPSQAKSRRATVRDHVRRLSCLTVVAAINAAILTGCLSRPPLKKELFLITDSTQAKTVKPVLGETLGIRHVTLAPQFEGRSLVYRISDTAYEVDPYAEFIIAPDRMIGSLTRQWLRASGLFPDVAEPNSSVVATRWAELQVTEMYGDFRQANDMAAVVSMRFVLLGKGQGGQAKAAFSKMYSRRVRLQERTAGGVVRGLQQAFAECFGALREDLLRTKSGE